jgi:NADPH2:quinone reductase
MKAAVLHRFGKAPCYQEFSDPMPGQDEIAVRVRAVALENIDRALAGGDHYAVRQLMPRLPAILGTDGIGMLEDGRLVAFGGMRPPFGSMAETAVIPRLATVPVPEGVDAATAAAVPGSALAALFPLSVGAGSAGAQTVLVHGATGFAGRLAVQVAKLWGAKRVVAAGRNAEALRALPALGADGVIDLTQSAKHLSEAFLREAGAAGYDVVLDFLWGRPTEALVASFIPTELAFARRHTRLVQIGEMAGTTIALPARALRTSGLEIVGAGGGISPDAVAEATNQVWLWIRAGSLRAEIERVPLRDLERAWRRGAKPGTRIVVEP